MEKQKIIETINANPNEKKAAKTRRFTRTDALTLVRLASFSVFALLLGTKKLVFDTVPLGFALLGACCGETPAVLLGLIAASFYGGELSLSLLLGACVLTLSRMLASLFLDKREIPRSQTNNTIFGALDALFCENTHLRVMSAAIGVFFCSIWRIVAGGFRFYDLFAAIFYLILTPVATLLFSICLDTRSERKRMGEAFSITPSRERLCDLSAVLLLGALILSLDGISLLGVSVPLLLAVVITLYICRRGILYGAIAGLILGAAVAPSYAPTVAFCAIAYCSLRKLSVFGGGFFACIAGLVWGFYIRGVSALAIDLPPLLCACTVFCCAERLDLFSEIRSFTTAVEQKNSVFTPEILIAEQKMDLQDKRLHAISDSFSSLSEIFYNLSTRLKRPSMLDLHAICEESFEKVCSTCERKSACFGGEYPQTLDIMKRMSVQLHSVGVADEKKLPESFKQKCPHRAELIKSANSSCAIATKKAFQNEKTEIFALDYDALATILNDALAENEDEFKIDAKMSKRISSAIAELGYGEHNVMAFGKRKLRILARDLDLTEGSGGVNVLRRKLEQITKRALGEPCFELSYGSVNMQIEAERAFSADCAFVSCAKDGESVCGDTISILENKNDYLYALISDGMGAGRSAALASEICNTFLCKMLSAGNRMESSLRMLNSVLRTKGSQSEDECSATIDLLQLDLFSGALTLVKSGAAPTFVLRRENVFKLASPSFPIGILQSLNAKQLSISCEDGDIIVMVSDGITQNGDDCPFLTELLRDSSVADLPAQKIADRIIRRAKAESDSQNDDASVIVLKVKKERCDW